MNKDCNIETHTVNWCGIALEVTYEAHWLNATAFRTAHLQVRSVAPAKEPLPISDTGYRSHFLPADEIDAHGGPAEYVKRWLDHAARAPEWRRAVEARQQLSLF
ncbi:MAG TPA: hypothetical protein VGN80_09645 [Devosiaceae bacterium]|jgi:hypothetical protein|nr:hypothetical protein [Devosiaceae bacterium]